METAWRGSLVSQLLSRAGAGSPWAERLACVEGLVVMGSVHASVGFRHWGEVSDELGILASSRLFAARVNEMGISNAGELNRVFQALPVFGEGKASAPGMSRQKATG